MSRLRAVLLAAVVAYAAVFAALGTDTMVRVWIVRGAFDSTFDVGVLLLYEGMRVLTIAAGVALSAVTAGRAVRSRHAASVTLLIVMLVVAYAKATAYAGFPGFAQERIARALLAGGWSLEALTFVFGEPVWALMLAAAAFLRLAVTYPAEATPAGVREAGARDRTGMLRSVAFAGVDVGALTRRACAWALERGALEAVTIWSMAVAAAVAQHFASDPVTWLALVLVAVGGPVALGIPALRAGLARSAAGERARILWFVEAALVAAFALMVGGILSAVPGGLLGGVSFALLAVAPMIVLLCAATALAPAGSVEPERALAVTAHWGATAVLVLAVVAALDAALGGLLDARATLRALVGVVAAAALVAPVHAALRVPASRLAPARLSTAAADP